MNDTDRNLQHAMTSFAYWGGMLIHDQRPPGALSRAISRMAIFVPVRLPRITAN